MKIRFWGVRGSVPTPGENTVKFGGNTACVEINTSCGTPLIFDAGTGIRSLGFDYLKRENKSNVIHLFISHVHWDHIQGFPYFVPIYLADMEINIYSGADIRKEFSMQMSPPYFPVPLEELNSTIRFHTVGGAGVEIGGALITPVSLVHPQEVFGYTVYESGKTIVYSSDTEYAKENFEEAYIETVRGADALLFDAQYTPEEYYNNRIGWGHSTYEVATEIAKKAGVKKLVLFHHEPTHNDVAIESIEKKAQTLFPATVAAREGMTIEV